MSRLPLFTVSDMARIIQMRRASCSFWEIMREFPGQSRDRLVEAYRATILRDPQEALDHLNHVFDCQSQGIPLINGRSYR